MERRMMILSNYSFQHFDHGAFMDRVADHLVDALIERGVERIYSLSGNQIMPIYDACVGREIDLIHVRHEAAAVYMAEAESQITGRLAVALVTAGPGFANAIGPLYSAGCSESPVLLISGDSPVSQDGKGAFQELDQVSLSRPLTKMAIRSTEADRVISDFHRLSSLAIAGRPGPVHLSIPFDLLNTQVFEPASSPEPTAPPLHYSVTDLAGLWADLDLAERPLLVFGPLGNRPGNREIVEKLSGPGGFACVVMESPRGLNDPALGALRRVLPQADRIVCLGKRVDFQIDFGNTGANPSWTVVDWETAVLNQAQANLGNALTRALQADPFRLAEALTDRCDPTDQPRSAWVRTVQSAMSERFMPTEVQGEGIHPGQICQTVQRLIARHRDAIIVADGGEFGQWAQAGLSGKFRIINGPAGAIGGGICYAIAAAIAKPQSPVFCLTGDGTAGFHLMEFETAMRHNASPIVIVGNDQKWNAEYQIQIRTYGRDRVLATALGDARYDLAVEALGGHGEFVEHLDALDGALRNALESDKPSCINVRMQGLPAPVPK